MPIYILFLIFLAFCPKAFSEITARFNTPISKRTIAGIPCQKMVIDTIGTLIAKKPRKCKIQVAMYSLDNLSILNKLNEAIAEGIEVHILLDKEQNAQAIDRLSDTKINSFKGALKTAKKRAQVARRNFLENAAVTIIGNPYKKNVTGHEYDKIRVLHEKFSVYSCEEETAATSAEDNPNAVILGSYNWTEAASETNYENCVKIQEEPDVIETFKARFEKISELESSPAAHVPPSTPAVGKTVTAVTPKTTTNTSSSTPGGSYSEQHKKRQEYEAKKKPTPALDRLASPSPLKTKSGTVVGIPRAKKPLKEGDDD